MALHTQSTSGALVPTPADCSGFADHSSCSLPVADRQRMGDSTRFLDGNHSRLALCQGAAHTSLHPSGNSGLLLVTMQSPGALSTRLSTLIFRGCGNPHLAATLAEKDNRLCQAGALAINADHDNYRSDPCDRSRKLVAFPSVQPCRVIDQPLRHSVNCLGSSATGLAQPGNAALLRPPRRYRPIGSGQVGNAGDKDRHHHQPMARLDGDSLLPHALHPDSADRPTDDLPAFRETKSPLADPQCPSRSNRDCSLGNATADCRIAGDCDQCRPG